MSVNMMAASLRWLVFSDGTKGLDQIVTGRKQQSVQVNQGGRGILPIYAECGVKLSRFMASRTRSRKRHWSRQARLRSATVVSRRIWLVVARIARRLGRI